MVKGYRVQIASNSGFAKGLETHTTDNTSYAPLLNGRQGAGSMRYWRVAAIDEGNNEGAWTTRALSVSTRLKVSVRGTLRKGRRNGPHDRWGGRSVRGAAVRARYGRACPEAHW